MVGPGGQGGQGGYASIPDLSRIEKTPEAESDNLLLLKVGSKSLSDDQNKILILSKVGFQIDQITAASWSGNTQWDIRS